MQKSTLFGALGGIIAGGLTVGAPLIIDYQGSMKKIQTKIEQTGISLTDYKKIENSVGIHKPGFKQALQWQRALDSLEAKASLNQALLAMKKGLQKVK